MNILDLKTTKSQTKYWTDRKINWKESYFDTWNHPHRFVLTALLRTFNWTSLMEVGVGGGANLANILKHTKGKQLGGIDVNEDAIEFCQKTFRGGVFKKGNTEDLPFSDKSVDVILSDMTYIYVGPIAIHKHIKEIRRVTRGQVVLCEFYEPNPIKRLWYWWKHGYFFHNWKKILEKYGFYDIFMVKLPEDAWPGGLQEKHCYLIKAKSPHRYV